jgi:hypothetical protein
MVARPMEAKLEPGFGTRTARLDDGVIGVVISTHERMAFALAANLEFQRLLGPADT